MASLPARFSAVILLTGVWMTGCTHSSFNTSRSSLKAMPAELAGDFVYDRPKDCPCEIKLLEHKPEYEVKRVQLAAATTPGQTNRSIELDYYDVPGTNKTPVVLVLPMLGGGYALERHFANYFASRGYAAVIVRRDTRASTAKVEDLNGLFHDMVVDHKKVIDWIETQPRLDAARVGIFGVSMGGIKGALLLPLDNRIKAAALGLAGGDLPYILTHTTEPGLAKRREQELAERHITLEQSEARLRAILTFDPIRYAAYVDPKKVLLVLARYDTVVPIEKGLELKKKMGNPETIMIPAGHYSAVLSIPYIKSQSFDFFQKRFDQTSANPGGVSLTRIQASRH